MVSLTEIIRTATVQLSFQNMCITKHQDITNNSNIQNGRWHRKTNKNLTMKGSTNKL